VCVFFKFIRQIAAKSIVQEVGTLRGYRRCIGHLFYSFRVRRVCCRMYRCKGHNAQTDGQTGDIICQYSRSCYVQYDRRL